MDDVLMISDMVWVRKGVAKEKPDKVKLDDAELKQLIEGGVPESTDQDSDEGDEEAEEASAPSDDQKPAKKGLRGSKGDDVEMESDGEQTTDAKYLAEYDEEKKDDQRGMRGIAMYTTNKEDPYVTTHVDSDEEEEADEIRVRPDDNMLAVAKIHKDEYTLEVYVYNEKEGDWYCHHDYILDAPPLCLEHIEHDPGNDETGRGNLVAAGTMKSEIHIWDLDIMNAVTPVVTLGKDSSKKKGRRKRDGSAQGHSDAVISLAWNRITPHVLASGGADKTVVLWDLDEAKPAQIIADRGGEVQTMSWHPNEGTFMLLGTMRGDVQVLDCRDTNGMASAAWQFEGQVEKVLWNHFNPFTAFVVTEDGTLRYLDMRKTGQTIWEGAAHEGPVSGLTLSAKTGGLLVTAGEDQMVNVWKVDDATSTVVKVHSEKLAVGRLHCACFNPDVATTVAVGGSGGDLIRVLDVAKFDSVTKAFS